MPLVTLTLHESVPAATRGQWLKAVHDALVAVGVPANDRFQRVIALDDASFVFDDGYPDAVRPRDRRFAIVELLWSQGRSVKVKRQFLQHLATSWAKAGHDPEQLMLVFKETAWENWSFAGGRLLHA